MIRRHDETDRPPLESHPITDVGRWNTGHDTHHFLAGAAWLYPCIGCGCEANSTRAEHPCPTPHHDPIAEAALLAAVLGELQEMHRLLRGVVAMMTVEQVLEAGDQPAPTSG